MNLPKLKTHKKAGHHLRPQEPRRDQRQQGVPASPPGRERGAGGDCYPGRSRSSGAGVRGRPRNETDARTAARALWRDWPVSSTSPAGARGPLGRRGAGRVTTRSGARASTSTHPARRARRTARSPTSVQRRVIHVVDAVVAGQGDGPLAPQPLALGLLVGGDNAAAVDWVAARMLGYDPHAIRSPARPSVGSVGRSRTFAPDDVQVTGDLGDWSGRRDPRRNPPVIPVRHPAGRLAQCREEPGSEIRSRGRRAYEESTPNECDAVDGCRTRDVSSARVTALRAAFLYPTLTVGGAER